MIRFSICGAASYACGELLRLMVHHPDTQVAHLADSFAAGRKIQDEHPALAGFYDQEILPLNDETLDMIVMKISEIMTMTRNSKSPCTCREEIIWCEISVPLGAQPASESRMKVRRLSRVKGVEESWRQAS